MECLTGDGATTFGLLAFGGAGTLTVLANFAWLVAPAPALGQVVMPLAALSPEQVQAWVGLVNTAILTFGGTVLALRQRWIQAQAEERHEVLLTENGDLKRRIESLTERVEQLKVQACLDRACPRRISVVEPPKVLHAPVPAPQPADPQV